MKPRTVSRFPSLLILGLSALTSSVASSATVTWGTNVAAGSYDWQTAANWTGGASPLAADIANFQKDWSGVPIITLSAPTTINGIQYDDTGSASDIAGMSITNGGTPANTLTFSGTTPTANIASGTFTISAATTLGAGFAKSGGGTLALTGSLTGWTDSLVNNVTGGSLTLGPSSGPSFTWAGVNKTAGAGTVQYQAVTAGNLTLPTTYSVAAGSITVNPTSGTFDGTGGFTKTGAGTLTIGTATTNVAGTYEVTGSLNLNGPIAIGASTVFKGAGTTTLNGVASGATGFTKEGSGTLVLGNLLNTFTGAVSATAGTLQLGNLSATNTFAYTGSALSVNGAILSLGGSSGSTIVHTYNFAGLVAPISLTDSTLSFSSTNATTKAFNGALNFSGSNNVNYSSTNFTHNLNLNRAITGSGTINFNWSGFATGRNITLASGQTNNFTGAVILNSSSGGVTFTLSSALGASSYEIRNAWTLVNNVAGGLNSASSITLTGSSSALTLTQALNNSSNTLTVDNGTVNVGNATSSIGNLSGLGGTIRGTGASSALTVNQTTDAAYAGSVSANSLALAFTKNGAASLTLSGSIDSVVPFTLNAGGLRFAGSKILASLNQTGGDLQFVMSPTSTDQVTTIAGYSSSGGGIAVNFTGPPAQSTYNLVSYGGTLTGTPTVTVSGPLLSSRYTTNVTYGSGSNDSITLSLTGNSASLKWKGDVSSDFALGNLNFLNGPTPDQYYNFDSVLFDDSASSFAPLVVGTLTPGILTFDNSTSDYTLGGTGSISGASSLIKSGSAVLTVSSANTYSGGTEISAGRLRLGGNEVLGSGTILLQGGTLSSDGASARTLSNPITPSADSTVGHATDNGNLTFSGILSGSGVQIFKQGGGSLSLTGVNTFSGGFNVDGGSLIASVSNTQNSLGTASVVIASGASVQLNNLNTTNGTGPAIGNAFSGTGELNLRFAAGTTTARLTTLTGLGGFDGSVRLSNAGATGDKWSLVGVNAGGTSVIVESGNQLYSHTTASTLAAVSLIGTGNSETRGALRISTTLNAPISLAGDATIGTEGGTLTGPVTSGASGTQTLTLGTTNSVGNLTFGGAIGGGTGTLALTKTAAGTAILNASNTYSGTTTISAGTLQVGNAAVTAVANNPSTLNSGTGLTGTLGSGSVVNNSTLDFRRGDNTYVVSNDISGTGAITVNGVADSVVTLSGNNTFTGNITIVLGGIRVTNNSALGTGTKTLTMTNGTAGQPALRLDGSAGNITLPSSITLATSVSTGNGGVINEAGDNTIAGNINLNSGGGSTRVRVAAGTLALTGNVTAVATGRFLILDGGGNGTLSGVVSNNGANIPGLQKEGIGSWTLTSTSINTYTATTQINGGTLFINGSTASGSAVSVANGATLAGSGTIAGSVNATAGSKISPGATASTTNTLNTGATTLSGTLAVDVDGVNADKLNVTGNLSLGVASAVTLNLLSGGFTQASYVIAECSGTLSGTFASVPSGYKVTYTSKQAVLSKLSGYSSWATDNANGDPANVDTDGDGVLNGVEYFMGETGSSFTVNPTLSGGSITWPKDPDAVATYIVQTSTDLITWNTATTGVNDTGSSVIYTIPTGDTARFARIRVTVP